MTDAAAQVLKIVCAGGNVWIPTSPWTIAYGKLARDSKLDLLFVHKLIRLSNASELVSEDDPAGFLLNVTHELMRILEANSSESTTAAAARCAFHEHGKDDCYRTKREADFISLPGGRDMKKTGEICLLSMRA